MFKMGFFFCQKGAESTSNVVKVSMSPKKPEQSESVPMQIENEVTRSIQENVEIEIPKDNVPSKMGIVTNQEACSSNLSFSRTTDH